MSSELVKRHKDAVFSKISEEIKADNEEIKTIYIGKYYYVIYMNNPEDIGNEDDLYLYGVYSTVEKVLKVYNHLKNTITFGKNYIQIDIKDNLDLEEEIESGLTLDTFYLESLDNDDVYLYKSLLNAREQYGEWDKEYNDITVNLWNLFNFQEPNIPYSKRLNINQVMQIR